MEGFSFLLSSLVYGPTPGQEVGCDRPTRLMGKRASPTWRRGVCTWDTTWGSRRHSRMAKLLAISTRRSMKLSCCSSGWQIARYPRYMLTFQAISLGQLTSTWWLKNITWEAMGNFPLNMKGQKCKPIFL